MKRKEFFLAVSSGLTLILAAHSVEWKYSVWLALSPLLVAVESINFSRSFSLGLITGLVYFAFHLGWISDYNPLIFVMVLPCASLFVGLFAGITGWMIRGFQSPLVKSLVPAFVWAGLQYFYGLTPLGSVAFDLETIQSLPFIQLSAVSGTAPVSFLFLLSNGLMAFGIFKRDKNCLAFFTVFALAVAGFILAGHRELKKPLSSQRPISVACVQPNFPISQEWRYAHSEEIFQTYREMITEASRKGAQLIVLPQYTLPVDVYRKPESIAGMARAAKAYLVLGTYTQAPDTGGRYNIALVFSPEGKLIGEYRAVRPPPFRSIGQVRGIRYSVVRTPLAKLGILLCYDDVVAEGARNLVQEGAEVLITLMNNGHFDKSRLLDLHFTRDILRAVETHRYVVRSAATGISAVMDSRGRVLAKSRKAQREIIYAQISLDREETLFVRYGNVSGLILALGALIFAGLSLKRYNFFRKP